jgi:hypothetical protein
MAATIAHVLVALDGSAHDREVVDVADRLARISPTPLVVVPTQFDRSKGAVA